MENRALVVALVEWVAARPRTYSEVMRAWRTSCPRLPIWEDAVDHGLVRREVHPESGAMVTVTSAGIALLRTERLCKTGPSIEG